MNQPDIRELLSILMQDQGAIAKFNQSFTIAPFQLGELISATDPAAVLYVVCEGRVRIVGESSLHQREVSVVVLEPGDTFGAEALFCDRPLSYQAIAATSGAVARIPIAALKPWLTTLPDLQERLKRSTYQREQLLFFKTATPLYALPHPPLQGQSSSRATPESGGGMSERLFLACPREVVPSASDDPACDSGRGGLGSSP
jgi:CRP-like cAMP-binding protein